MPEVAEGPAGLVGWGTPGVRLDSGEVSAVLATESEGTAGGSWDVGNCWDVAEPEKDLFDIQLQRQTN